MCTSSTPDVQYYSFPLVKVTSNVHFYIKYYQIWSTIPLKTNKNKTWQLYPRESFAHAHDDNGELSTRTFKFFLHPRLPLYAPFQVSVSPPRSLFAHSSFTAQWRLLEGGSREDNWTVRSPQEALRGLRPSAHALKGTWLITGGILQPKSPRSDDVWPSSFV